MCAQGVGEEVVVVQDGKATAAQYKGATWEETKEGLSAEGTGRFLYATKHLAAGDFHITARLKLARLDGTAASFVLNDSHLGFDGRGITLFIEGPLFGGSTRQLGMAGSRLKPNTPFVFEVIRASSVTRYLIDGVEIHRQENWNGPVAQIGFRPWRNRITLESFGITGNLIDPPPRPIPLGKPLFVSGRDGYDTYRIPALAVTGQGTILAFCEGRKSSRSDTGNIDLLMKRSTDRGQTWSEQRSPVGSRREYLR